MHACTCLRKERKGREPGVYILCSHSFMKFSPKHDKCDRMGKGTLSHKN